MGMDLTWKEITDATATDQITKLIIKPYTFANCLQCLHSRRTSSIWKLPKQAARLPAGSDLYSSMELLTAISPQFIPSHTAPPVVNTTPHYTHTHTEMQKYTSSLLFSHTSPQLNHPSAVTVNASQPAIQQRSISIESLSLSLLRSIVAVLRWEWL